MEVRDFDPTAKGSILIPITKSGKSRRVLLTPTGKPFFESITAGRASNELVFLHEGFVGMGRNGEKVMRGWKRGEQQRPMEIACEAAGLAAMGFHQLRHSYASALIAAGMPIALVAKLAGHSDTRMLEKHYSHLAPSDLSRSLEIYAPQLETQIEPISTLAIKLG